MRRAVQQDQVRAGACAQVADIGAAQRAPPAVADQTASRVVIRISRTASATHSGMLDVKQDPGLQSVASATVTPAASSRRASG